MVNNENVPFKPASYNFIDLYMNMVNHFMGKKVDDMGKLSILFPAGN